jgi:hypothetical protein
VTATTNPALSQLLITLANDTITNLNNQSLLGFIPISQSYIARTVLMPVPSFVFSRQATAAAMADVLFIYTPTHVNVTTLRPRDLRFAEVILYTCTKAFETEVKSGVKITKERDATSRMVSGATNTTSFNGLWNLDKFDLQPQFTCKPDIVSLSVGMAPPEGVTGRYEFNLCTALMMSTVLNQYMPGFTILRAEDRVSEQTVGMISSALGTMLFGGFMGDVPGPDVQSENLRVMARNIADGLTNMQVHLLAQPLPIRPPA